MSYSASEVPRLSTPQFWKFRAELCGLAAPDEPVPRRNRQAKYDSVILTISLIAGILLVCRPLKDTERGPMRSFVPTAGSVERQWHVIDAEGQVLGRIATEAARLLQGKHKPVYTPHIDMGDHVVIVNAAKVKLTGRKEEQKLYRYHSGYEGGLREERAKDVRQKNPVRLVEEAVRGMLPKTKLGEAMWRKLKVYAGGDHPHAAQMPRGVKTTKQEVE